MNISFNLLNALLIFKYIQIYVANNTTYLVTGWQGMLECDPGLQKYFYLIKINTIYKLIKSTAILPHLLYRSATVHTFLILRIKNSTISNIFVPKSYNQNPNIKQNLIFSFSCPCVLDNWFFQWFLSGSKNM